MKRAGSHVSRCKAWEFLIASVSRATRTAWPIYGQLKREGKAKDVTMSEFADIYRQDRPYSRPECTLWKDIL
jgi:hypothetical protein